MRRINIKKILLIIVIILTGIFHGTCIQTKHYKIELTEEQKQEIIDAVSEQMAGESEAQESKEK